MPLRGDNYMGLQKSGLLEVWYSCITFNICRVAQWAYMVVVVLEDTTTDEYEESRMTLAAWHTNCDFAKKIMENNALFAATMLSKQSQREPDLVVTIRYGERNCLDDIRDEIQKGIRKPIEDPELDRILKIQENQRLKKILDVYGDNPQFSPKKVWVGMLLLLLYPFGVPFFYLNKPLWGSIMLGYFVLACVSSVPLLIYGGGILGIVFIVMTLVYVFSDRARDKDGRFICSKRMQKEILDSIAQYKKNLVEIEVGYAET